MSTLTQPTVVIDGQYPVSDITVSSKILYGKNQPFPKAVIKVQKNLFNSLSYWEGLTPAVTAVPTITDATTTIAISSYGSAEDMVITSHDSDDSYITFTCYHPAYKLKKTKISSLASFTTSDKSTFAFTSTSAYTVTAVQRGSDTSRFVLTCALSSSPAYTVYFQVYVEGTSTYTVSTEYMFGDPGSIFAFFAIVGAGYLPATLSIDSGFTYDYGMSLKDSYTSAELTTMKATRNSLDSMLSVVKLRTDAYCWAQIQALGYLTNRIPFFYDRAYFVDYNAQLPSDYYQSDKSISVNYGTCTEEQYDSAGSVSDIEHNLSYIATNADQGSNYIRSSQEVTSENYKDTLSVSDVTTQTAGTSVYYAYPCFDSQSYPDNTTAVATLTALKAMTTMYPGDIAYVTATSLYYEYYGNAWHALTGMNQPRNFQTMMIGLNLLLMNYHPGDCVAIQISEVDSNAPTVTFTPSSGTAFTSYIALFSATGMSDGDIAMVSADGSTVYFQYSSSSAIWTVYGVDGDRSASFLPYTRCETFTDNQNSITITNAPLACTEVAWPSCITTLWWGDPQFMDATQQVSSLESVSQDTTTTGNTDSTISDKYAAKLVIGSQALSDLTDDRENFYGLIIEKNWNNDLYRLAGYEDGTLNAYFNSDGKIMSGNGSVVLSASGIVIGSGSSITLGGVTLDENGLTGTGFTLNSSGLALTSGSINIGGVTLNSSGLTGTGFTLNSSGLTLTSGNITIGGVTLNSSGLTGTGFSLTSSGLTLTSGSIHIGNTIINSSGATLTTGTIGGNSFTSSGIVIHNGSLNIGHTYVNSTGTYIDIADSGEYSGFPYAYSFSNGSSLSSSTCAGGLFGTANGVFLTQGGSPTLFNSAIILSSSGIYMDGASFEMIDHTHSVTAYPINFISNHTSAGGFGCLSIQCGTANVTANQDNTITFDKVLLSFPVPAIFFVPVYASSGSGGIGTDMHFKYFTSSSSGITGFVMRIPDRCTQIDWTVIGLLAA